MIPTNVKRPRNVDWKRAAAILYGDWGTSKAYVIGLAFAVAGYASFWLIALMCVLTALVGINYMIICRLYPDGGGVYASVRHRSEVISIVGAFLLIADYLVTAAISALSAFQYLGVPHPEKFAAAAILAIGLLNLLGPKQTGGLAFLVSIPSVIFVIVLGMFILSHWCGALCDHQHCFRSVAPLRFQHGDCRSYRDPVPDVARSRVAKDFSKTQQLGRAKRGNTTRDHRADVARRNCQRYVRAGRSLRGRRRWRDRDESRGDCNRPKALD